jgi:phage terminase small subunit
MVVDAFIEIIDKLIELARYKKRRKKELFTEVVDPLFKETQMVVDEYFLFFRNARSLVRSATKKQYPEVINHLNESRNDFLIVRVKITEMAKAIRAQTRVILLRDIAASIERFFEVAIIDTTHIRPKKVTIRKHTIRMVEKVEKQLISKNEVLRYIDRSLKKMEEAWIDVAAKYAKGRIDCLEG